MKEGRDLSVFDNAHAEILVAVIFGQRIRSQFSESVQSTLVDVYLLTSREDKN